MTLPKLKRALLSYLGYTNTNVRDGLHDDVVNAFNKAFQVLWLDVPKEFRSQYTRTTISVSLLNGTASYTLPGTIQSVLSPVMLSTGKKTLRPVDSEFEIHNFAALSTGCGETRPMVYFLDRTATATADACQVVITVAPTPVAAETMTLRVEKEAPRFVRDDFCDDAVSPPAVPIPHQYVESILLPIATWFSAENFFQYKPEMLPRLEKQYVEALRRAGASDPEIQSMVSKTKPNNL